MKLIGPMLAFRCADRGLIAFRSTSQNVRLDEGKIIMALASTAALMPMKERRGWLFRYSNQMEELGAALSATGCRRCRVILRFPCDTRRPVKVACLSCRRKSGICLCRVVTGSHAKMPILTTCEGGVEFKASIFCL